MRYQCPACLETFDEPGFCPHDGTQLASIASMPTVVTSQVTAQPESETIEQRQTAHGVGPQIRAVSASESPAAALELLRTRPGGNAYDRLVGQTLDRRYIVERKIGEGGMGVVFAVRHNVIERPLAIKVLKREVMRDSATISRFKREAQAASRIGHPNIVDVTDFGETPDGMTYSVMEFVDGQTLAAAIKHGAPFPAERVIRVASQIARALEAAHNKGIVHRDLKPENVFLVDREGRPDFVKIVDFGIAKVQPVENAPTTPRLTRAGAVFGTPEYMAPEQAAGRGDTDRRVDVYALGTIMYEMLVAKVPHKGGSMMQTIAMQMLDPITTPSQVHPDLAIPPALEAIVMKALAKPRDQRYQTMAELLTAFEHVDLTTPSPTLSLPPLPPGADPTIEPSPSAQITSVQGHAQPRRAKPQTRPMHEPEFVSAGSRSFDHVFEPTPAEPKRRRWPYIALALLVIGGGAAVGVLLLTGERGDEQVAHGPPRDAGRTPDAMIAEVPVDAAVPADAELVIGPRVDGGHVAALRDGGVRRGMVTVTVYTRPGDANVYIDNEYRGENGTHVELPAGVKQKIECRIGRYHGSVEWDGVRDVMMCTAIREPLCVPGLHNPIDHCDDNGPADAGVETGPVTRPR